MYCKWKQKKIEQETYFLFLSVVHTHIETCSLSARNLCISFDFTMFHWTAPTVVDKHF